MKATDEHGLLLCENGEDMEIVIFLAVYASLAVYDIKRMRAQSLFREIAVYALLSGIVVVFALLYLTTPSQVSVIELITRLIPKNMT